MQLKPKHQRGPRILHKLAASPKHRAVRLSTDKINLLPWTDIVRVQAVGDWDWERKAHAFAFK